MVYSIRTDQLKMPLQPNDFEIIHYVTVTSGLSLIHSSEATGHPSVLFPTWPSPKKGGTKKCTSWNSSITPTWIFTVAGNPFSSCSTSRIIGRYEGENIQASSRPATKKQGKWRATCLLHVAMLSPSSFGKKKRLPTRLCKKMQEFPPRTCRDCWRVQMYE